MRARWVILIIAGALAIACAVLLLHPTPPATINAKVLGKTNDCYTVLISNGTRQAYYVEARTEFWEFGAWNSKALVLIDAVLEPKEEIAIEVPDLFATRDGPRRIAVSYIQTYKHNTPLERWMNTARELMRLQRNPWRKMYLEVGGGLTTERN